MRLLALLVSLTFFPFFGNSQNNWQKVPNLYGGATDLLRANDQVIVVTVKDHGLYFSTDTGNTWQASSITEHVSGLLAENGLVIAFTENRMYYSTDNCSTFSWKTFFNPPANSYLKNGRIYVSGYWSGNKVSADTGTTWTALPYSFQDLAIEGSHIYASGQFMKMSHDGGLTWSTDSSIKSVKYITVDSNKVWATTDDTLYYSSNFGNTWTVQFWEQFAELTKVHKHGDTLYLCNNKYGPDLLRSVNSGFSWQLMNAPQPVACRWYKQFCIFKNAFFKSGSGVYRSYDCANWVKSCKGIRHTGVEQLKAMDGVIFYLTSLETSRAEFGYSPDNGNTWKVCIDLDSSFVGWKDYQFTNGKLIAADWHYGLYLSNDTGKTWSYMNYRSSFFIQSLKWINGKLFLSEFEWGNWIHNHYTTDMGNTWKDFPWASSDGHQLYAFNQMAGSSKTTLMISGYVFRSSDGGINWTKDTSGNSYSHNIACIGDKFYSIRSDGIYKSDANAINWTRTKNTNGWWWNWFTSYGSISGINNVIYVTNRDTIYYSKNGGLTWFNDSIPSVKLSQPAVLPSYVFLSTEGESIWRAAINTSSVDIAANSDVGELRVFPNPSAGNFCIKMDEGCSFKTAKLTVYDVHGRIVMEKQLNTDQSEVKILNGSPGVYVLKLDDGERVSTCRHVISE